MIQTYTLPKETLEKLGDVTGIKVENNGTLDKAIKKLIVHYLKVTGDPNESGRLVRIPIEEDETCYICGNNKIRFKAYGHYICANCFETLVRGVECSLD